MRTRPKALVLAVIISVVAFAPIAAFAQQEQAQAATQVTVDLSELERSGHHEPLAQTGDTRQFLAAGINKNKRLQTKTAHQTQPVATKIETVQNR